MRGLPKPEGNYCYVSVAVQQLFNIAKFRDEVLDLCDLYLAGEYDEKEYGALASLGILFNYINGEPNIHLGDIKKCIEVLGHNFSKNDIGSAEDSLENIMKKCKQQMRSLKVWVGEKQKQKEYHEIKNLIKILATSTNLNDCLNRLGEELGSNSVVVLKNNTLIVEVLYTGTGGPKPIITEKLKISEEDSLKFVKNKNDIKSEKFVTKFELIGLTINSSGAHYFVYVKNGSSWTRINDEDVKEKVSWSDVEDSAKFQNATQLIYKAK